MQQSITFLFNHQTKQTISPYPQQHRQGSSPQRPILRIFTVCSPKHRSKWPFFIPSPLPQPHPENPSKWLRRLIWQLPTHQLLPFLAKSTPRSWPHTATHQRWKGSDFSHRPSKAPPFRRPSASRFTAQCFRGRWHAVLPISWWSCEFRTNDYSKAPASSCWIA